MRGLRNRTGGYPPLWRARRGRGHTLRLGTIVSLATLAAVLIAPDPILGQTLDRVLVVVNDDVITQGEFDRELDEVRRDLASRGSRLPPDDILARQSLERMIATRVQLHRAELLGVRIPEQAVQEAIELIATQNGLSPDDLRAALESDGVPYDQFRDRVEDELKIRRLRERQINPQVVVTEEEIETAIAGQVNESGVASEFDVSHILVGVSESASGADEQQARALVEQALNALAAGADFAEVAARYSQAGDALEGGRLGWRGAAQLPELFVEALIRMAPGDVSDVLRSPNGFHIVRLNASRGGSQRLVQQYQLRHILIRPDDVQTDEDVRQRLELLRERIANGDDFGTVARANSMDPASRARGGELGWVNNSDLDPAVQKVIRSMDVGEVSRPIESPFGFHIMQLQDRRNIEVNAATDRDSVRDQIFARKAEELYERWVRELMDQAYIKYN